MPISIKDQKTYAALRHAIDEQNTQKISNIIRSYPKLNLNKISNSGVSALLWACEARRDKVASFSVIDYLLSYWQEGEFTISLSESYAGLKPRQYLNRHVNQRIAHEVLLNIGGSEGSVTSTDSGELDDFDGRYSDQTALADFISPTRSTSMFSPSDDDDADLPIDTDDTEIDPQLIQSIQQSLPDMLIDWFDTLSPLQKSFFATECKSRTAKDIAVFAIQNNLSPSELPLDDVDLSGADLRGCDLSDLDLSGVNLNGADLRLMQAKNTTWEGCDLTDALFNQWLFPEALLGSVHCSAELLRKTDERGMTLIQTAILDNRIDIIQTILASHHRESALGLPIGDDTSQHQETALHFAINNHNLDAVNAILNFDNHSHSPLYAQDNNGDFTPLHAAISQLFKYPESKTCTNILNTIIFSKYYNKQILTISDNNGYTPFHYAVANRVPIAIRAILSLKPPIEALANKSNTFGNTPLHTAVLDNRKEIVEAILQSEHAKHLLEEKNNEDHTPLETALKNNFATIVEAILSSPHCSLKLLTGTLTWAIENKPAAVLAIVASRQCTAEVLLAKDSYNKYLLENYIKTNKRDNKNSFDTIINKKIETALKTLAAEKSFTPLQSPCVNQFILAAKKAKPLLSGLADQGHLLHLLESTQQFTTGKITPDEYQTRIHHFTRWNCLWAKPVIKIMAAILLTTLAAFSLTCLAVSCGVSLPTIIALNEFMMLPNTVAVQVGYGCVAAFAFGGASLFAKSAGQNIKDLKALPEAFKQVAQQKFDRLNLTA